MTSALRHDDGYLVVGDLDRIYCADNPEQLAALAARTIRGRENVEAVHVREYRSNQFGPTLDIYYEDGRVSWLSHPGGFAHSGYYHDGVTPAGLPDERPSLPHLAEEVVA